MTLRAARKRARLSKSKLAELAGLHRMTVARLENNETSPLYANVVALEQALGCTLKFPRRQRRVA